MTYTPIYDSTINAGDVIAVGDCHACLDLLDSFLDYVKDTQTTVIVLGDICDRGPDSLGVFERVEKLLEDPESWGLQAFYCLRGNHEQLFLDACEGYDVGLWAQNGGDYHNLDKLSLHYNWVKNLPIYMTVDDTLFLHAGVFPGMDPAESIEAGRVESLVWLREPFMTVGPQLEKWTNNLKRVVHAHTPFFEDEQLGQVNVSQKGDRIGIDSGAYFTGVLTSYNSTRDTFQKFTAAPATV